MRIESPNDVLAVTVETAGEGLGEVSYSVERDGEMVIAPSRLGVRLESRDFTALRLVEPGTAERVRDSYRLVSGKQIEVESIGTRQTLVFEGSDEGRMIVTFHVADDGVAFRYGLSGIQPDLLVLDDTTISFAADGSAWIQPHDLPGYAEPAYEAPYSNAVPIGHRAPVPGWAMPALFESGGHWVLAAESDLAHGGYGARLSADVDGREYAITFPHPAEGMATDPVQIHVGDDWESSWRVLIVGDLSTVVESTLITDLASPSQLDDSSWIRPGRVSWSWWSEHGSPTDPAALRRYIDLAADMGWEHTLIDANWNTMPPGEIEMLLAHAAERGVGVFLWYNSGGPNNQVIEQPRDLMYEREVRRAEFARLAGLGVAGVKVDFFHSDRPEIIDLYLDILEDAADHQIMVNFHGSTVPRGWTRTWPHLMTMEAVRGAEQYSFRETYPEEAVWHNTILPFTRNAIGPMDYTPVTFSNQLYPKLTTDAHELALAVVYESGLQHLADNEASYRAQPPVVQEFLRDVPAVWDETRFVAGHPGEYAVIARRSGDEWWIGAINGGEARDVLLDLGFVGDVDMATLGDPDWATGRISDLSAVSIRLPVAGGWVARSGS